MHGAMGDGQEYLEPAAEPIGLGRIVRGYSPQLLAGFQILIKTCLR